MYIHHNKYKIFNEDNKQFTVFLKNTETIQQILYGFFWKRPWFNEFAQRVVKILF